MQIWRDEGRVAKGRKGKYNLSHEEHKGNTKKFMARKG